MYVYVCAKNKAAKCINVVTLRWTGSLWRMQLHVSCRALDGLTTSRYTSCTGFRFGRGWISR